MTALARASYRQISTTALKTHRWRGGPSSACLRAGIVIMAIVIVGPATAQPSQKTGLLTSEGVAKQQSTLHRAQYRGEGRGPNGWTVSPRGAGSERNNPDFNPNGFPAAGATPAPVERDTLSPVLAGDGSGLPLELWGGLQLDEVEQLIAKLTLPSRSPTLHDLWKRLMTAGSNRTGGTGFAALSLEALYRSGLSSSLSDDAHAASDGSPVLTILNARHELADNKPDAACKTIRGVGNLQGDIPARLKGEAILLTGFCAAEGGNDSAAGLAAELAREQGVEQSIGLAALDAISVGSKARLKPSGKISVLDYRLAAKAGGLPARAVLQSGEPALLAALANDSDTPADIGLAASEAAARINAIEPAMLAAIYRANGRPGGGLSDSANATPEGRATLFRAAEDAGDPTSKARLLSAFVEGMRREGLSYVAARMIGPVLTRLRPSPNLAWFGDIAAEAAIVSGDYQTARQWAGQAQGLSHWAALADLSDPADGTRGASLQDLERRALAGQFDSETLHRLVTVLDAHGYLVPIPLWEAASRTTQPTSGFLPETGVLSKLQDAAKKREFGRTALLVMQTLGPDGPDSANLITLGDSIRALKRAGLEDEARKVGLEALIARWPRGSPS